MCRGPHPDNGPPIEDRWSSGCGTTSKNLKEVTILCGLHLLVVVLSIADFVTQQETSEVLLWDDRPLQHSRIQGHIGEGYVLRTSNWGF